MAATFSTVDRPSITLEEALDLPGHLFFVTFDNGNVAKVFRQPGLPFWIVARDMGYGRSNGQWVVSRVADGLFMTDGYDATEDFAKAVWNAVGPEWTAPE